MRHRAGEHPKAVRQDGALVQVRSLLMRRVCPVNVMLRNAPAELAEATGQRRRRAGDEDAGQTAGGSIGAKKES